MKIFMAITVFIMVFFPLLSKADVPEYTVMRTTEKIVIDGILDDPDWATAQSFGDLIFSWDKGSQEQSEVKMLWDDTFLYVAINCEDKNILANFYDTNSATYKDDSFSIFWNPNPEAGVNYNMFEINCIGNLLSVYRGSGKGIGDRVSRIMVPHIAQSIHGTVNNEEDTDTGWILEIAIRFEDYPELSKRKVPIARDMWRVGLNRMATEGGTFILSQWSPTGTPKPGTHVPEMFGEIIFSNKPVQ